MDCGGQCYQGPAPSKGSGGGIQGAGFPKIFNRALDRRKACRERKGRFDITDAILEKAIEIKATNSLSVCDSWIVATAIATDSTLVHKDPEFEPLERIVKLKALPYKPLVRKTKR